jgi:hypothetical protein
MGRINAEAARQNLTNGFAVGVGESHTSEIARTTVISWINDGLVKTLFIEFPRNFQGSVDSVLNEKGQSENLGPLVYTWLVKLGPDTSMTNTVTLGDVVAAAYKKGVPVLLADAFHGKGHSKNGMIFRDQQVADFFRANTQQDQQSRKFTPACVILFGAHHFERGFEGSLPSLLDDLDYVIFGGPERWNLGGLAGPGQGQNNPSDVEETVEYE